MALVQKVRFDSMIAKDVKDREAAVGGPQKLQKVVSHHRLGYPVRLTFGNWPQLNQSPVIASFWRFYEDDIFFVLCSNVQVIRARFQAHLAVASLKIEVVSMRSVGQAVLSMNLFVETHRCHGQTSTRLDSHSSISA